MKSNLLRIFLEWALISSVLMSVACFVWLYLQSRSLRRYEYELGAAQAHLQTQNQVIGNLISDSEQYARTNPDLERLLEAMRAPGTAAAAQSKPGAK